jgi:Coenzyme PQQ synthesis protein D (PqqD)
MLKVKNISNQSLIQQNQESIVSDMDGETVMMSIQNGKYYNLGTIGGLIWNKIVDPITFDDLIKGLVTEYDIEKIECEKQVISFLESLYKEKLITFL